jgi:predicted naringenin-chalcone synthase
MKAVIQDFHSIRPNYEMRQEEIFTWLIEAHVTSEMQKEISSQKVEEFRESIRKDLYRVGCKPQIIKKRGFSLPDFMHQRWEEMTVYRLQDNPEGVNLRTRSKVYEEITDRYFDLFYPSQIEFPEDLLHVTCTGYISPSGAQKIVCLRNANERTRVTHMYHMGCYASLPAIRVAASLVNVHKSKADIVHTEICTLHNNPANHSSEQLVVQSLFADGFIKYRVVREEEANGRYLQILAFHEQLIPDSSSAMRWSLSDGSFEFFLSKEIPWKIKSKLPSFVQELLRKAGLPEKEHHQYLFAIHPGGSKILQHTEKVLDLKKEQMKETWYILGEYGNMSSATLPHIWEAILKNPVYDENTIVISLAFGPGLTIIGSVLKIRGR